MEYIFGDSSYSPALFHHLSSLFFVLLPVCSIFFSFLSGVKWRVVTKATPSKGPATVSGISVTNLTSGSDDCQKENTMRSGSNYCSGQSKGADLFVQENSVKENVSRRRESSKPAADEEHVG